MNRSRNLLATLVLVTFWLGAGSPVQADEIYVYQTEDGSRLITDHPRIQAGYRLLKVYSQATMRSQIREVRRAPGDFKPLPSSYDDLIANVARQARVDPMLIKSVMHAESAFNPRAVSRKGAAGLMQLMPGTAERYGVSSIFDPRQNILGGARYLNDLLELFNGRLELVLAGYNAGENAVLRRGGIPPYPETRHYVKKVMHLYREYRSKACRQGADTGLAADATIISCSGATAGAGFTNVGQLKLTPPPDSVSSADEGQWRPVQ